jgi:hypothetical protein
LVLECREVRALPLSVVLAALVLAACTQSPEPIPSPSVADPNASPTVSVLTEQNLERNAAEIAAFATAQLRRNAVTFKHQAPIRIIAITAVDPQQVRGIEPEAPRLEATLIGPVWVVRALGTFGTFRGPTPEARVADSGFFVIADADRSILATGFP